jgi:hypothetical protein
LCIFFGATKVAHLLKVTEKERRTWLFAQGEAKLPSLLKLDEFMEQDMESGVWTHSSCSAAKNSVDSEDVWAQQSHGF